MLWFRVSAYVWVLGADLTYGLREGWSDQTDSELLYAIVLPLKWKNSGSVSLSLSGYNLGQVWMKLAYNVGCSDK